jgi:hypothetical protein
VVGSRLKVGSIALVILLIQFVIVPFLGNIDIAAKLFVFVFLVLITSLFFSRSIISFYISPILYIFIIFLIVTFFSACLGANSRLAFIQSGILIVFLLFLILITHLSKVHDSFHQQLIDVLLLFGTFAAILGFYEYVHFILLGPSRPMLIPYLLPPDNSIRVAGPYGQPNLFAVFLSVTMVAFFYRHLHTSFIPKVYSLRWLRFLPLLLVGCVFFQTGSRAGIISLVLIFGFLSWLVVSGRYLNIDLNICKSCQ